MNEHTHGNNRKTYVRSKPLKSKLFLRTRYRHIFEARCGDGRGPSRNLH